MSGAGKGDKPRPTNLRAYRDRYDQIKWGAKDESAQIGEEVDGRMSLGNGAWMSVNITDEAEMADE